MTGQNSPHLDRLGPRTCRSGPRSSLRIRCIWAIWQSTGSDNTRSTSCGGACHGCSSARHGCWGSRRWGVTERGTSPSRRRPASASRTRPAGECRGARRFTPGPLQSPGWCPHSAVCAHRTRWVTEMAQHGGGSPPRERARPRRRPHGETSLRPRWPRPILDAGHECQREAPARWPATLLPRWGAPGEDLAHGISRAQARETPSRVPHRHRRCSSPPSVTSQTTVHTAYA